MCVFMYLFRKTRYPDPLTMGYVPFRNMLLYGAASVEPDTNRFLCHVMVCSRNTATVQDSGIC